MTDNTLARIVNEKELRLVEEMKEMILGEEYFSCPMDDWYLLRYIRYKKYNVNEAFEALLAWWKERHRYPELMDDLFPSTYEQQYKTKFSTIAAHRDKHGRQIILWKVGNWNTKETIFLEMFRSNFPIIDTITTRQLTQVEGCVAIFDLQGLGIHHVQALGINSLRMILNCVIGFPMKVKGIHFVNHPKIFQLIWSVAKTLLKPKMRQRVQFHSGDFSSLHNFFEPTILPKSYGGNLSEDEFEEKGFTALLLERDLHFRELLGKMGYANLINIK